jgi:hypothetical protein
VVSTTCLGFNPRLVTISLILCSQLLLATTQCYLLFRILKTRSTDLFCSHTTCMFKDACLVSWCLAPHWKYEVLLVLGDLVCWQLQLVKVKRCVSLKEVTKRYGSVSSVSFTVFSHCCGAKVWPGGRAILSLLNRLFRAWFDCRLRPWM